MASNRVCMWNIPTCAVLNMNAPITNNEPELSTKEWNAALDRFLVIGDCESDTYFSMSLEQQGIIQELKKAFKRIRSRLPPEEP